MGNIFISWGGEKSERYAQYMEGLLQNVFETNVKIFFSPNIESGRQWLEKINKALSESEVGIILLTRQSLNRPWVNFEAGALFKGETEKTAIIPICVDISYEDLKGHPLGYFQGNYRFNCESVIRLFKSLRKNYGFVYHNGENWEEFVRSSFETFERKRMYETDIIEEELYRNRINISENTCLVAEIPDEKFWGVEKETCGKRLR